MGNRRGKWRGSEEGEIGRGNAVVSEEEGRGRSECGEESLCHNHSGFLVLLYFFGLHLSKLRGMSLVIYTSSRRTREHMIGVEFGNLA